MNWQSGAVQYASVVPQNPAKEQHSSDAQLPLFGPHVPSVEVPGVEVLVVVFVDVLHVPYVDWHPESTAQ